MKRRLAVIGMVTVLACSPDNPPRRDAPKGQVRNRGLDSDPIPVSPIKYWGNAKSQSVLLVVQSGRNAIGDRLTITETPSYVKILFNANAPSWEGTEVYHLTLMLKKPLGDRVVEDDRGNLIERARKRPAEGAAVLIPTDVIYR